MSRARSPEFNATIDSVDVPGRMLALIDERGMKITAAVAARQPLERLCPALRYTFRTADKGAVESWTPVSPDVAHIARFLRYVGCPTSKARPLAKEIRVAEFLDDSGACLAQAGCSEDSVSRADWALPPGFASLSGLLFGAGADADEIYRVYDALAENPKILPSQYEGWARTHGFTLVGDLDVRFSVADSLCTWDEAHRAAAAVRSVLSGFEKHAGDTWRPKPATIGKAAGIAGVKYESISRHVLSQQVNGVWVKPDPWGKSFVERSLHHTESPERANKAVKFIAHEPLSLQEHVGVEGFWTQAGRRVHRRMGPSSAPAGLDATQARVAEALATNRIVVVLGAAGTGKTHTVKKCVDRLAANGATVAYTATTGRAAQHLDPENGKTLHSFLAATPGSTNHCTKRRVDVLVIDECSMLDTMLGSPLGSYLKADMAEQLVLVGDPYQLPPVGAGKVLWDMSKSIRPGHAVVTLDQVHRTNQSGILDLAGAIREETPLPPLGSLSGVSHLEAPPDHGDVQSARWKEMVSEVATIVERDPGTMVISPSYEGRSGIHVLNRSIRDRLLGESDEEWMVGERVIQRTTKKIEVKDADPLLFVNGMFGEIAAVSQGTIAVTYEDGTSFEWERNQCRGKKALVSSAYALTVHRAQGQQAGQVVVVCDPGGSGSKMWSNPAFGYTAVTRAASSLVIVGEPSMLSGKPGSDRAGDRLTSFAERIATYRAHMSAQVAA
jgi:hypothetical protein